jgi:hypothetical protein
MKVNGEHYFKISQKLKQFETSSKLCPPFLLVFTVLYISIIVGLSWAFLNIFIGLQKMNGLHEMVNNVNQLCISNRTPWLKYLPCSFRKPIRSAFHIEGVR